MVIKMAWCNRISEIKDFLAFVVLFGPDNFPTHRNMNIEKAFEQIFEGLKICKNEIKSNDSYDKLCELAKNSHKAYLSKDIKEGAHLLQDMRELM